MHIVTVYCSSAPPSGFYRVNLVARESPQIAGCVCGVCMVWCVWCVCSVCGVCVCVSFKYFLVG